MSSQSTLTLIDALTEQAAGVGAGADDDVLRTQAALVRAILDEVGRFHPSDPRVAALHEQLGEELFRLVAVAPLTAAGEGAPDPDAAVDVLLVDDDPATLHASSLVVSGQGYPCRTAASAAEALGEYARRPAAIVISDWSMPGMSGLDLCRTLKLRDPHVYFLLVTAHEEARLLEGVRGGIDDFLLKPIDIDDLAKRLRAAHQLVRAVRVIQGVRDALRAPREGDEAATAPARAE
jgi:CheY-like chemotaxis protein